jgi:hypothetical protein
MIAILCRVRSVLAILDNAQLQRAARSTTGARRQPTPLVYDLLPGMFEHHEPRTIYVWQSCGLEVK